jgi:hypothetical protein
MTTSGPTAIGGWVRAKARTHNRRSTSTELAYMGVFERGGFNLKNMATFDRKVLRIYYSAAFGTRREELKGTQ